MPHIGTHDTHTSQSVKISVYNAQDEQVLTVPSSSGPVRKHTAKFEPAAWSWAQMMSGSEAPNNAF